MTKRRPRRDRRAQDTRKRKTAALMKIGTVVAVVAIFVGGFLAISSSRRPLVETTQCPPRPESLTVLLVDVTDPMTTAQRQDFLNQLERLKASIPRYGQLSIFTVDSAAERLLSPKLVRCNPGTGADENELTGNPTRIQRLHDEQFDRPLDQAFREIAQASGAEASPILESLQSAALTELNKQTSEGVPRRIILVSDLLQNTPTMSFYRQVPEADAVLASPAFQSVRTDLRGIEVELWMLQRPDAGQTQPRALPNLWTVLIEEQGGTVARIYRVSG